MKTDWTHKDCLIRTCSFCGYKHKEKYYNHPNPYTIDEGFGKKPFKVGENKFVYKEERDYSPNRTVTESVYACPRCGILQIEDEDLD